MGVSDLIIDVGLYDGTDAAYYLGKGYRVVAIEADPLKAESCSELLSRQIEEGKLTILNVGIAESGVTLPFYRNHTNGGWSSFKEDMGTRGGDFDVIQMNCTSLAEVIQQHGIPFYLKVDIEGLDEMAVSTLTPELAPDYISVEAGMSGTLLPLLSKLGYESFKLINQDLHTTSREITDDETGWRLLRKLTRVLPSAAGLMRSLPRSWHSKTEWDRPFQPNQQNFGPNATGPFGEETEGAWISYGEACRGLRKICSHIQAHNQLLWLDVHAKR